LNTCSLFLKLLIKLYLHAVDHRKSFSVFHALPVLRRPLPWTHNPILALGGWDGEVLPGVGLGGDGVGLWTRRGRLILNGKKQKTPSQETFPGADSRSFVYNISEIDVISHLCSRY